MRRLRLASLAASLVMGLTFALATGCRPAAQPSPAPEPPKPRFTSLTVFPPHLELIAPDGVHGLAVTAVTTNGLEIDVSEQVRIATSQPEIVAVTGNRLAGLQPGQARVEISLEALRATATVAVSAGPTNRQTSFVSDVLPVLSKMGCNAGACHAKPDGQNGFKLSVFAYDPQADYHEIVREGRGRRIFPAHPPESLLLKKPTLAAPHEGGLRLDPQSAAYATLVRWIEQGMPYRRAEEPRLERIEVHPAERLYPNASQQRLLVRATYADGSVRDVTDLTEFSTNDKTVATVDESGRITTGKQSGEAVIVARFMGLVDTSRVTIPEARQVPEDRFARLPVHNEIDRLVDARLKKLGLAPSDLCTDSEFLRRSSLDAIGTLPTPEEARRFLTDPAPDKRDRWIDHLLAHPHYADHWAVRWGDLLRPNPSRVGVKSVYLFDRWIRESLRANQPYDQFVRELLTAQGSTHRHGPAVLFRDKREPADLASFVSQIFMGVRLDCARCHHHPNEKWGQDDYFQLAAFFGSIKRKGQGISAPISGEAEFIYFAPGGQVKHPLTGETMAPKPPDGPVLTPAEGQDPRGLLADWLTASDNRFLARAVVNRIWWHYFGRGIVDPVDDFRASNLPTNEPLLDHLAADFVAQGFDLKQLMRTIMRSRTYQLSSLPNEFNAADTRNFSRSYRRRLTGEVLQDAVSDTLGVPEDFQGLPPGGRAIQTWNHKLDSDFLDAFNRPNASAECPCERDDKGSVVQALHLMNARQIQTKLTHPEGRAKRLAASSLPPEQVVEELYLATLSRFPTPEEQKVAVQVFSQTDASRQSAVEDLLWALLNSAEFVFNH